ncbi:MAG: beta-N-acetylhexosaminidase [Desulfosporosinus sp.]|jgi:beta-N-acetylhexosaminidase
MRKKYLFLILAFALLVILVYVFTIKNIDNENVTDLPGDVVDPIKEQIKGMSLEEKIGQLVMVGVDGYENNENSQQLIKKYHVGGIVLLQKNVKDANQMLSLVNSLKETNSVHKIPLFLAIDEEGGRVSRMPVEFTKIPSSHRIGELNNSELSYRLGGIIGEELKSFGLNMNFAPVLDVNSNPQNPVIGDRAFGDEPNLVSKLGIQTMKGLQMQNIISVVKHFPGHGDTAVDSHIGLPIINHDIDRLNNLELVPFYKAIESKVDAIMLAHILLPKIDTEHPASFSQIIISEILRTKMSFDGVIITDDMTMGAIENNYDIGEAAVRSINAGSDIVLVCHDFVKKEAVIQAIKTAAQMGIISPERIDQSVYRILVLKRKYALTDKTVESVNPQIINDKIEALFRDLPTIIPTIP